MRLQLSFIYLTLKFIFYLSTDVNGQHDDEEEYNPHKRLYEWAVQRPTGTEITVAISDSNVSRDIQIGKLQPFFYVGRYPDEFIQLLNTSKTLSPKPIIFTSAEITTLTSDPDDESKNKRIVTQIKFYQKLQEIRCTNYVHLLFILPDVKDSLEDISRYVYNMIDVSYKGKFIVNAWIWELHIKLLGLQSSKLENGTFLNDHLPEINETLMKSIMSCRENKYLMDHFDHTLKHYMNEPRDHLLLQTFLEIYDQTIYRSVKDKELYTLRIGEENFLFRSMWDFARELIGDTSGLDIHWYYMYDLLVKHIENINDQYEKRVWTTQPSKYIEYHELILDAIKARLYSYIWIHLVVYQKLGCGAQKDHDWFLKKLNENLDFIYTDQQPFNEVLILLSKISERDDEKITEAIKILSKEVNRILISHTEPQHMYQKAEINNRFVERICMDVNSKFLEQNTIDLDLFVCVTKKRLNGSNLSALLFYINGTKTTDFVLSNTI
ncbi:uncharacterized protein LOC126837451 [Adelges cooleyi]|uniref:uncharacterized protein LOC126837451 n=1 Tax=Adelges cooleyi TaxID=133065 RepID=UPI00217F85F3|nr:uncharacterized protein LOC126837451 [Adelges cooleyi]